MKRILLFTTIFALLVLPVSAQKTKSLTNADKAQIIQAILLDRRLDMRYSLPDEERLNIYLSIENISRNAVPGKIGETKISLKSPQEIEKEKENWREYFAFGKFEADGAKAVVSFYNYRKNSKTGEFERLDLIYEYRKTGGKWKLVERKHPGLIVDTLYLVLKTPNNKTAKGDVTYLKNVH